MDARRVTALAAALLTAAPGAAKDLGTHGPVWEIAEPSLFDAIQTRLQEMEEAGDMAALEQEMQDKTRAYVMRPPPVMSLTKATQERIYEVDLSITVTRDLEDHQGRVFARAGTVLNPLDYSMFNKRIVIFDGDDPEQVAFALKEGTEVDTLLVLTNGAPLELMREHGRRFYFDQNGIITERFEIRALPAEVMRGPSRMYVREVALEGAVQ